MAKIYETLRKKSDPSIEVYPNIESQNIPNGAVTETKIGTNAITTGKLANNSVNSNKLADGSVSTTKLVDSSVTNTKIADNSISNVKMQSGSVGTSNIVNNAVTTDKIASGSINDGKLNNNLWNWYKRLQNTYILYAGSGDEKLYGFLDTFTADDEFNEYADEDINDALDFDRASSSDYSSTDLRIYKLIIDGLYKDSYGSARGTKIINGTDRSIALYKSSSIYTLQMYEESTNTKLFELKFDGSTYTITDYYYSTYIYLGLRKLINNDITYER